VKNVLILDICERYLVNIYKPDVLVLPDCFFLAKQYSLVKFGQKCVQQAATSYLFVRNVLSDEGVWNSLPESFIKEVKRLADKRYQNEIDEDNNLAENYQKKRDRLARELARRELSRKKEEEKQQATDQPEEDTGEEIVFQVAITPKKGASAGKKKKSKKKGKN
jgi:hypothetical protein